MRKVKDGNTFMARAFKVCSLHSDRRCIVPKASVTLWSILRRIDFFSFVLVQSFTSFRPLSGVVNKGTFLHPHNSSFCLDDEIIVHAYSFLADQ